jgi:PIN domain nuclease of toxin-antitoxin system
VAVLLDTHIVLGMLGNERETEGEWREEPIHVSVASLWEIAIKVRQGKLDTGVPLSDFEARLEDLRWTMLQVTAGHALAEVSPWPETNDPFDRLLLAVCEVQGLRLVTRDRKLVDHPLAWKPAAG